MEVLNFIENFIHCFNSKFYRKITWKCFRKKTERVRQTLRNTERDRETARDRERQRETARDRETSRDRETARDRETEKQRNRETEKQRKYSDVNSVNEFVQIFKNSDSLERFLLLFSMPS